MLDKCNEIYCIYMQIQLWSTFKKHTHVEFVIKIWDHNTTEWLNEEQT